MSKIEVAKIATYSGHRDCIYTIEKGIENHVFFTASGDGMVVKWDLTTPDSGELFAQVPNSVYAICIDPINQNMIIGENFMGLHFISLKNKTQTKAIKITEHHIFDIKQANNKIIIACGDGSVIIINQDDHSLIKTLQFSNQSARCICVNESTFYVGYSDNSIRSFDLNNYQLLNENFEHSNSVFSIVLSHDKSKLLSAGRDATLKIWNASSNLTLEKSIVAHMFAINNIYYSPDGKLFATCSMDKSIKIWDAENFSLLKVIDKSRNAGHATSINKLMWTTFNNNLISVSDDRNISIWNIDHKIKNIK